MSSFVKFLANLLQALAKRLLPVLVERLVQLVSRLTGTRFQVLLLSAD